MPLNKRCQFTLPGRQEGGSGWAELESVRSPGPAGEGLVDPSAAGDPLTDPLAVVSTATVGQLANGYARLGTPEDPQPLQYQGMMIHTEY